MPQGLCQESAAGAVCVAGLGLVANLMMRAAHNELAVGLNSKAGGKPGVGFDVAYPVGGFCPTQRRQGGAVSSAMGRMPERSSQPGGNSTLPQRTQFALAPVTFSPR